jgi:hypothetical protein
MHGYTNINPIYSTVTKLYASSLCVLTMNDKEFGRAKAKYIQWHALIRNFTKYCDRHQNELEIYSDVNKIVKSIFL